MCLNILYVCASKKNRVYVYVHIIYKFICPGVPLIEFAEDWYVLSKTCTHTHINRHGYM